MATIKDLLSSMIAKIHTKVDKEDFEALGDNMFTVDLEGAPEGDGEIVLLNADLLGGKAADNFATKDYVSAKIADAQLGGGENGDIDLSGFMLKTDTAVNSNKLGGKDPEYYLSPWLIGTTDEITPMQVYQALLKEQNVMITYPNSPFGAIAFTGFGVVSGLNIIAATEVLQVEGDVAQCQLVGSIDNTIWNFEITTIPTTSQMASLTAEDVGALPSTGTATDSAKLGGKAPKYYLPTHNLLVNSNFANPVNRRGQTSYTEAGCTIDRWEMWIESGIANVSLMEGYISISFGVHGTFYQKLAKGVLDLSKQYSLVTKRRSISSPLISYPAFVTSNADNDLITLADLRNGDTMEIEWCALYEGEYTAETLPPYVPKEYAIEALNCGVPMHPRNLLDNSDFTNPVNQRGQTSYTNSYGIDRWRTWDGHTITVNNGYISIAGSLFQYIELSKVKNTNYTLAVCRTDGSIVCLTYNPKDAYMWNAGIGLGSDGTGVVIISIDTGDYLWAALYEGEYTAETLPPYVPKPYMVELAECQRYYVRLKSGIAFYGFVGSSGSNVYLYFDLPEQMRISNPTVTTAGRFFLRTNSGNVQASTISKVDTFGKQLEITVAVSMSGDTPFNGYAESAIEVSADL